jgi:predicted negative regulator of RcsB-dependent stress response
VLLRSLAWLALTGLMAAPVAADRDKPQQVQDLQYGEVLFHFYQQDYFTAISHLMTAQSQQQLLHHQSESELLLGGLQLSYGMLDQAEQRFNQLLDSDQTEDVLLHDRVRFYLTKINYQRGHYDKAFRTLAEINTPGDPALRAELALLGANIRMERGDNADAAKLLAGVDAPADWDEYLRINRGIAQLRAGDIDAGRATLDKLGQEEADDPELRALRDRANLALGYELLRAEQPAPAREFLNRVRLQGPFMQAALLGAGWADAERGDYQQALTPWLQLLAIGDHQPMTHEARLAVPYALARLGDQDRAIFYYEQAIENFDQEQQRLDAAATATRNGTLLTVLSQVDTGSSGGWLQAAPTLEDVPSGALLVDVLSANSFQEALKDYRDLGYLDSLLQQWLLSSDIYHDMVDTRRLAYQQRAPQVRARLQQQELDKLQARWQQYSALVAAEADHSDPQNLATGKEKRQWQMLDNIQQTLGSLPDEDRFRSLAGRSRWLQGVLYWQIQSDYRARLWDAKQQLTTLQATLQETAQREQNIAAALASARAGFDGYDTRIDSLQARITALLPAIRTARIRSSEHLQQLVLQELEQRQQRLASYRSQARYALARSYDRLATAPEPAP